MSQLWTQLHCYLDLKDHIAGSQEDPTNLHVAESHGDVEKVSGADPRPGSVDSCGNCVHKGLHATFTKTHMKRKHKDEVFAFSGCFSQKFLFTSSATHRNIWIQIFILLVNKSSKMFYSNHIKVVQRSKHLCSLAVQHKVTEIDDNSRGHSQLWCKKEKTDLFGIGENSHHTKILFESKETETEPKR